VTPIRPNTFPVAPAPGAAAADAARQAAQRAFFDAAMGRAAAPPPAAQPAQPIRTASVTAAPVAPQAGVRFDPAADPPSKLPRPGSLLDIRV
jgi:hypothetical protein